MRTLSAILVAAAAIATPSLADVTLSASMTVDNEFTAYLSTDDTIAGTQFLSGTNWGTTYTGSTTITAPGTYYLHIAAVDTGPPAMFIGLFTLAGSGASFSNGTQQLLSNITDWHVSDTGFDGILTAPIEIGPNGTGPWGTFPAMGSADFIWAPNGPATAFFTATITVIPAPAGALTLLVAGAAGFRRRR